MRDIWFAIGQFTEWIISVLITPWGWLPVTTFILVMAFGALYWLMWQGRYNRRAKEHNELM